MTEKLARISEAEWQVMEVLWDEAPLPSSEIIKRLDPHTNWNPKTIHTLIGRLVKKKVVGLKNDNPPYLYYPLISREKYSMQETESFIDRVYKGSASMLVARFIKGKKLSPEEAKELKELLEEAYDEEK